MAKHLWAVASLGLVSLLHSFPAVAAPQPGAKTIHQVRAGLHIGETGAENRLVFDLAAQDSVRIIPSGPQRWHVVLPAPLSARAQSQLTTLSQRIPGLMAASVTSAGKSTVVLQFDRPTRLVREFRLRGLGGQADRHVLDFAVGTVDTASAPATTIDPQPAVTAATVANVPPESSAIMLLASNVEPAPPSGPASPPTADTQAPTADTPAPEDDDATTAPPVTDPSSEAVRSDAGTAADASDASSPDGFSDSPLRVSGFFELEGRWFPQDSREGVSEHLIGSIAGEPSIEYSWDDGNHMLRLTGFARIDTVTGNRTHADIREAKWVGVFGPVELTVGADRRFWGVIEAAHLVNIINQVDTLEDVDAEDYLGQPMVSAAVTTDLGTFSAFFMPYFRERLFPDRRDRPNAPIRIERALTQYQSDDERWHPDWAVRWSLKTGPLDLGVSHFSGTSREPRLLLMADNLGRPVLAPRYDLIDQTGVDLQATLGAWLLKFEGIHQWNPVRDYGAFAAGVEYTLYGVSAAGADLGLLLEYLYDERGKTGTSPFDDDLFLGLRWSGNDIATTELLAGAVLDLDTRSKAFIIEASRRLGESWRISLDGRFFTTVAARDPLIYLGDDDFLQLKLQYHF